MKKPKLNLVWIRGQGNINFHRPNVFFNLGARGAGKSALLELFASKYLDSGGKVIDLFGCYDEQTEALTRTGWKYFKDINYGDEIATLDDDGFIAYHHPTAIQKFMYKGEMIRFGGWKCGYDLLVTPDHNMLVEDMKGRRRFIKARELSHYANIHKAKTIPFHFLRTAKWRGEDRQHVDLPLPIPQENTKKLMQAYKTAASLWKGPRQKRSRDVQGRYTQENLSQALIAGMVGVHEGTVNMWLAGKSTPRRLYKYSPRSIAIDPFLRFLGWYLAEGNLHKIHHDTSRVEITQYKKRGKLEIAKIFHEMGFNPKVYGDKIFVNSGQLYTLCKPLGHSYEKYVPEWVKHLPPERLAVLIDTMMKGDGHGCVYYTSSNELADDFQEIAIKRGYAASIGQREPRNTCIIRGRQITGKHTQYEVSLSYKCKNPQIMRSQVKVEDYDGWVYDVTVPNHTLLVRRNGKAVWCGNSKDGEGLSWLRSPYAKNKRIVLLRGDLVEVKSNHESIPASKFRISDLARGDIFISASPLYESMDAEFDGVNRIIDALWKRHYWKEPIFLIMREAANLIYSRIKVRKNQVLAKAEVLYQMRESRHMGLALGLDSIKHTSIDVDIRVLTDYLIIKNTGMHGLPKDLYWVYKTFDPVQLRRLKAREFAIVDRHGHLGLGTFDLPPWHKREAENILRETGVELRYFQPAAEGDRLREILTEALQSLPPEPEPNEVSAWLKVNRGMEVDPIQVGKQARLLGYRSDVVFRDGKMRRVIRKNP